MIALKIISLEFEVNERFQYIGLVISRSRSRLVKTERD